MPPAAGGGQAPRDVLRSKSAELRMQLCGRGRRRQRQASHGSSRRRPAPRPAPRRRPAPRAVWAARPPQPSAGQECVRLPAGSSRNARSPRPRSAALGPLRLGFGPVRPLFGHVRLGLGSARPRPPELGSARPRLGPDSAPLASARIRPPATRSPLGSARPRPPENRPRSAPLGPARRKAARRGWQRRRRGPPLSGRGRFLRGWEYCRPAVADAATAAAQKPTWCPATTANQLNGGPDGTAAAPLQASRHRRVPTHNGDVTLHDPGSPHVTDSTQRILGAKHY